MFIRSLSFDDEDLENRRPLGESPQKPMIEKYKCIYHLKTTKFEQVCLGQQFYNK